MGNENFGLLFYGATKRISQRSTIESLFSGFFSGTSVLKAMHLIARINIYYGFYIIVEPHMLGASYNPQIKFIYYVYQQQPT